MRTSASSGSSRRTSRMRSRSMTDSPISGSRTAWSAFRIFSCFSASPLILSAPVASVASVFCSSAIRNIVPPKTKASCHAQAAWREARREVRCPTFPEVTGLVGLGAAPRARAAHRDDLVLEVLHLGAALEDDPALDHERRRRDVALDAGGLVQLDGLGRLDVPVDLAVDDDRPARDLSGHLGALPDDEHVARRDLAREGAVDADRPFEGELAVELRALAQERVQLSRAGARRYAAVCVPVHVLVTFPCLCVPLCVCGHGARRRFRLRRSLLLLAAPETPEHGSLPFFRPRKANAPTTARP